MPCSGVAVRQAEACRGTGPQVAEARPAKTTGRVTARPTKKDFNVGTKGEEKELTQLCEDHMYERVQTFLYKI